MCAYWICGNPKCNHSENAEPGDRQRYGRTEKPCPKCGRRMFLEWDEEYDHHED
jgi:ssDNA-binding Zn-finger/Zn-ribbon topoisomerase 1